MVKIVDGRIIKDQVLLTLKNKIAKLSKKPKLAVILVGEDPASIRYVNQKQKAAEEIGALFELVKFTKSASQKDLEEKIEQLNNDKTVSGILVQLPLPKALDTKTILAKINPSKDVDGLTENSPFQPATPLGVMEILRAYKVKITGKNAVVIGQSRLVGEPLSKMLEEEKANVVRVDIKTPPPIDPLIIQKDIVISAVGKPGLVRAEMIKEGAVVIDVGTTIDPQTGKLLGDVDFENVAKKASLITPVPGGVGPVTVAMLLSNLFKAAKTN